MKNLSLCFANLNINPNVEKTSLVIPTLGYSIGDQYCPEAQDRFSLRRNLFEGELLSGNFSSVKEELSKMDLTPFHAAILLFAHVENAIGRAAEIAQLLGDIHICGGVGASGADMALKNIEPVTVALIKDSVEVRYYNIHDKCETVGIETKDEVLLKVDGMDALKWYEDRCADAGLNGLNMEALTLSNEDGKNIHFSLDDDKNVIGHTEYPENRKMRVRFLHPGIAHERFSKVTAVEDSIFFGCAGLKSLLTKELFAGRNSSACFLFGEFVDQKPYPFANLMISSISLAR